MTTAKFCRDQLITLQMFARASKWNDAQAVIDNFRMMDLYKSKIVIDTLAKMDKAEKMISVRKSRGKGKTLTKTEK